MVEKAENLNISPEKIDSLVQQIRLQTKKGKKKLIIPDELRNLMATDQETGKAVLNAIRKTSKSTKYPAVAQIFTQAWEELKKERDKTFSDTKTSVADSKIIDISQETRHRIPVHVQRSPQNNTSERDWELFLQGKLPEPEKTLLEIESQIHNLCRISESVIKNNPTIKNNISSDYYPFQKHCKVLTTDDFRKEVVSGMSQSSYFGKSEKHQELIKKWAEEKCAFMFPPTGTIFFKKEGWQTNAMRFFGIQNFNHELAHLFTNAKITKQEALTEKDKEYLRQESDWMNIDEAVLENLLPQITICWRGLIKDYMLGETLFCREGGSSAINELYADIFGCHVQILALAHKNNMPYKDILSGMIQFEKIQAAPLQKQPTRNDEEETVLQKCLSLLVALKYLEKTKKVDDLIIAGLKGDMEQFIAAGDKTFGQDIHRQILIAFAKNEYAAALKMIW